MSSETVATFTKLKKILLHSGSILIFIWERIDFTFKTLQIVLNVILDQLGFLVWKVFINAINNDC